MNIRGVNSKMNVRQYNEVNRAVRWMSEWGKQSINVRQYNGVSRAVNVRQYNGVNRAVKWMSDNTMG